LAQEVETVLQSDNCLNFLQHMYGNEPENWREDLRGLDRLRFITNAFTRMRICAVSKKPEKNNALELRYKEGVDGIPAGYAPWFTRFVPPAGWRVLFGHWAALETHTGIDNIIALDSGCIWGDHLTMLRIDDGNIFILVLICYTTTTRIQFRQRAFCSSFHLRRRSTADMVTRVD
jgi:bis(5'-nucleosyl)-tetraphosphatase (symmetrical)